MKLIRFKVKGNFNFPLDMLRYDACFPVYPEAPANIQYSMETRSPEGYEIELAHWAPNANWTPTVDRWSSFGWYVTEINT
jgi:hypothetical protein